jgi:hypothetical protein
VNLLEDHNWGSTAISRNMNEKRSKESFPKLDLSLETFREQKSPYAWTQDASSQTF